MSPNRFGCCALKITAMLMLAVGAVSIHGFAAPPSSDASRQAVQSMKCPTALAQEAPVPNGRRDDSGTLHQQTMVVGVPRTALVRVDHSGRIIAAATNTGCPPHEEDRVFVIWPDGTIETAGTNISACGWTGTFAVPGRFERQNCGSISVGGAEQARR